MFLRDTGQLRVCLGWGQKAILSILLFAVRLWSLFSGLDSFVFAYYCAAIILVNRQQIKDSHLSDPWPPGFQTGTPPLVFLLRLLKCSGLPQCQWTPRRLVSCSDRFPPIFSFLWTPFFFILHICLIAQPRPQPKSASPGGQSKTFTVELCSRDTNLNSQTRNLLNRGKWRPSSAFLLNDLWCLVFLLHSSLIQKHKKKYYKKKNFCLFMNWPSWKHVWHSQCQVRGTKREKEIKLHFIFTQFNVNTLYTK